jgi:5-methyltetrahydrofolate--homocysteine methyltransferase
MTFQEALRNGPILFDGAMGTQLIERGLRPDQAPEIWNEERPDEIREIHRLYFEAGADVTETNTFGGTPVRLGERNLADRSSDLNRAAAELATSERGRGRFVAGSMGPTGKMIQPLGPMEEKDLILAYAVQAKALFEGGCDLLLVETQYDLREAVCALRGAREACPLPVGVTLTFERKPKGFFTVMGVSPEAFVEAFRDEDAAFLGANCTLGSDEMIGLAEHMRTLTDRPLLFQPNAGRPIPSESGVVYPIGPADFAGHIRRILDLGIDAVGGCCGTTPEHVAQMRRVMEES